MAREDAAGLLREGRVPTELVGNKRDDRFV
jgi:hypothetical protein